MVGTALLIVLTADNQLVELVLRPSLLTFLPFLPLQLLLLPLLLYPQLLFVVKSRSDVLLELYLLVTFGKLFLKFCVLLLKFGELFLALFVLNAEVDVRTALLVECLH